MRQGERGRHGVMTHGHLTGGFERTLDKMDAMEQVLNLGIDESLGSDSVQSFWYKFLGEWRWDLSSHLLFCHQKRLTILGYDEKIASRGMNQSVFVKGVLPQDMEEIHRKTKALLRGKSSVMDIEYRILSASGAIKTFYDRGVVVRWDSNNRPQEIWGIGFDITKRRELERENVMLAKLPYTNPDIIAILNLDGETVYINPTGQRVIKKNISEALPEQFLLKLKQAYMNNQLVQASHIIDNRNYRVKIMPMTGENQCMVSLSDITDIMRVKKDRDIYYQALQSIKQALIITNAGGEIIHVNKEFERLYGYTESEIVGKNPRVLNAGRETYRNLGYSLEEYSEHFKEMWAAIMDRKVGTWEGMVINRSKAGKIMWVHLVTNAIFNDRGEIDYLVGMPIDMTSSYSDTDAFKRNLYKSIAQLAELRDLDTGAHMKRVGIYAKVLSKHLGMSDKFCEDIELFAPMHDLGKVGIPDAILLNKGRLSAEEFEVMKRHTIHGYNIVKNNSEMKMVSEIALSHHERYDGTGYPNGLKGEDIPLSARIVAVADVYDALRSARPYKEPWPHERTKAYMIENSGTHFDPNIITAFIALNEQFARIFDEVRDN